MNKFQSEVMEVVEKLTMNNIYSICASKNNNNYEFLTCSTLNQDISNI